MKTSPRARDRYRRWGREPPGISWEPDLRRRGKITTGGVWSFSVSGGPHGPQGRRQTTRNEKPTPRKVGLQPSRARRCGQKTRYRRSGYRHSLTSDVANLVQRRPPEVHRASPGPVFHPGPFFDGPRPAQGPGSPKTAKDLPVVFFQAIVSAISHKLPAIGAHRSEPLYHRCSKGSW